MTIFPIIQPQLSQSAAQELPLCRDAAWDYKTNAPLWRGGSPVLVTGAEAVYAWAWRALHTRRYRHEPYSRAYGSELDSLIGQSCSPALKRAEAVRYVRECLTVNPYITDVDQISVEFRDGALDISCQLVTIYGEVLLHVG